MGLAWGTGNNTKTMYFVFLSSKPNTSLSPVAIVISYGKKCQNYFCVTSYLTIRQNIARWDTSEERNQGKDDRFWLLWGIFKYIKQNIIMVVLRKAKFCSVDICRLMKNQSYKKRLRRKIDSNFNFFNATDLLMRF